LDVIEEYPKKSMIK